MVVVPGMIAESARIEPLTYESRSDDVVPHTNNAVAPRLVSIGVSVRALPAVMPGLPQLQASGLPLEHNGCNAVSPRF